MDSLLTSDSTASECLRVRRRPAN